MFLFEAARLDIAAKLFVNGVPCQDCIKLKEDIYRKYLLDIKHGKYIPPKDDLLTSLSITRDKAAKIPKNPEGLELFTKDLLAVMKIAMNSSSIVDSFIKSLTENEKTCLIAILKTIKDNESHYSISRGIIETGVSRPVFKNVFQKLKDSGIAEVTNHGAKGTHLKLLETSIMEVLNGAERNPISSNGIL